MEPTKRPVNKYKRKAVTPINRTPISPVDALCHKLDKVAHDMEVKWGSGVLVNLVGIDTAQKFLRAKDRVDTAIQSGDYDTVKAATENLAKGWLKMDEEAVKNGHSNNPTGVWYVSSPKSDIQYLICNNALVASQMASIHPSKASAIFTIDDIAKMIEDNSIVNIIPNEDAKAFAAEMKRLNTPSIHAKVVLDDEIPF